MIVNGLFSGIIFGLLGYAAYGTGAHSLLFGLLGYFISVRTDKG